MSLLVYHLLLYVTSRMVCLSDSSYVEHTVIKKKLGSSCSSVSGLAKIEAPNENENPGKAVSLSSDGRTIAVSSVFNKRKLNENGEWTSIITGVVRVYIMDESGSWSQLGNRINGDNYMDGAGYSISLSDDGRTIAIGMLHKQSIIV